MAHEIATTADGRNARAYVGETPWHGLGQNLQPGAPIEVWCEQAGMNFALDSRNVMYQCKDGSIEAMDDRFVLVRDDTEAAMAVVSDRYKIVQPRDVLEFYRDLVAVQGFELETAGVLKGGRRFWALAKTHREVRVAGNDVVGGYMLLATSCDGTLATTAKFTTVRVVCQNTLHITLLGDNHIQVPHSRTFDPQAVKVQLGVADAVFTQFSEQAGELAKRKVNNKEAVEYLIRVMGDVTQPVEEQTSAKQIAKVLALFQGGAMGSNLRSSEGTAWGLLNAVTEYVDHHRNTRTRDSRLNRAWFGDGAATKETAWQAATALIAA